jgi:type I restriction enzyme M protein
MNMAIRAIEANLGVTHADSFQNDLHKNLKADFILANPPFNDSDWGGDRLRDDVRWKYGTPSPTNANFAWVQHIIHHLGSTGIAGFVLANGSLGSTKKGEKEIRKNLIESDLVECIVALPSNLFLTTSISACLWFISKNKSRKGETLFLNAKPLGKLIDRKTRIIDNQEIFNLSSIYQNWKTNKEIYQNIKGLCKSASIVDIMNQSYELTPGRYVGIEDIESIDEGFFKKINHLSKLYYSQLEISLQIDVKIRKILEEFHDN